MKILDRVLNKEGTVRREIRFALCPLTLALQMAAFSLVFPSTSSAEFKKAAILDNSVVVSSSLSPDRKAASVLFTNLSARLSTLQKGPAIATREISFRLPVEDTKTELRLKQDIRGFVQCQPGATAVAFIRLGGATNLVNLSTVCQEGKEFVETFYVTLAPGTDYQGTVFLVVDRSDSCGTQEAQLTIDSIDIVHVAPDDPLQKSR